VRKTRRHESGGPSLVGAPNEAAASSWSQAAFLHAKTLRVVEGKTGPRTIILRPEDVAKRIGGKRYLSEEVILRETQLAWRSGASYSRSARAFAEREARKAGLID